jgi:hypothetical protein
MTGLPAGQRTQLSKPPSPSEAPARPLGHILQVSLLVAPELHRDGMAYPSRGPHPLTMKNPHRHHGLIWSIYVFLVGNCHIIGTIKGVFNTLGRWITLSSGRGTTLKWGFGPKMRGCCLCGRELGLPTSSRLASSAESNWYLGVNVQVMEKMQTTEDLTNHPEGDTGGMLGCNCHAYNACTLW